MAKRITSIIWPDKHRKILHKMHAAGATAAEIAAVLGRTRNSIIGFIHRSGLSNTRPKKQLPPKVERKPQVAKPAPVHKLFQKPIVEIETPQSKDGVLFIFSNNRHCKWIQDSPNGIETRICGNRSVSGKSWCAEHFALVYNKQPVFDMRGQLHV